MASGFKINKQGIKKVAQQIEREFAKNPVRIPVNAEARSVVSAAANDLTTSESELVAGWLIDWGFAYSKERPDAHPSIANLMVAVGAERYVPTVRDHVDVAYTILEEAGLLKDFLRGYGGEAMDRMVWLTDAGRREATARLERRKDNRARRNACRDALMRWVYEQVADGELTPLNGILNSPYGWFNGMLYDTADLKEAAQFLRERDLLDGSNERIILKASGIECVEQYDCVVDYLNRRDSAGVNVTIFGNNSGQLAVANRDVKQSQDGADQSDALAIFANALREFGRLVPVRQPEYQEVASALEREMAKAELDHSWVQALFGRAKGLLEEAPADLHNLAQVTKVAFDIYGQTSS